MTDPDRHIWDGMLAHLRSHHATICRAWFEELEPLGIAGGALQLRTHSPLHRDYLKKNCAEQFADALQAVSGRLLPVRFLGPDDAPAAPPAPPTRRTIEQSRVQTMRAELKPDRAKVAQPVTAPVPTPDPAHADIPVTAAALPDVAAHSNNAPAETPLESVTSSPARPIEVLPDGAAAQSKQSQTNAPAGATPRARVWSDDPVRYESLTVNPDYSFDTFVMGPTNRLAHAAALAVAREPGRVYNPMFVHGGVGLGKTHLLQAICLQIVQDNPRAVLYYTSCEGFISQYFDAVRAGQMSEFRHRFRDVDVLVIDDIHFLNKRDQSQEEFFHTFNSLFQASKQIILSSDAAPEDIPQLEERLVSRFKWGLVAKIEAPDYETRIQILKTKARLRGLPMPDDVAQYLADKIDTNIRELEGAIVKLQILSNVEKRPIDLALAKQAVGDDAPIPASEPTIQAIINAVCEFYTIRLADLQSKHRQRSIALPRQVCMYLARRLTRHSLEEIGGFFGGRDHTTVMHAIKNVEDRRDTEPDFLAIVKSLEDRIRHPARHD